MRQYDPSSNVYENYRRPYRKLRKETQITLMNFGFEYGLSRLVVGALVHTCLSYFKIKVFFVQIQNTCRV